MRAVPTFTANPGSPAEKPAAAPVPEKKVLGPEDALVMVLFPKTSWDAVVQLAGELGLETPEALGQALLLLRAQADAAKKGG